MTIEQAQRLGFIVGFLCAMLCLQGLRMLGWLARRVWRRKRRPVQPSLRIVNNLGNEAIARSMLKYIRKNQDDLANRPKIKVDLIDDTTEKE